MCDICRREECLDMCPNNLRAATASQYCVSCGRPLYRGETAYDLDEGVLCEDCVKDAAFEVID